MPFLTINGVKVYNHLEPLSNEERRIAGRLHATHDRRRLVLRLVFLTLFFAFWIWLIISLFISSSDHPAAWQPFVFASAVASWVVFRSLVLRDRAVKKARKAVLKGKYRSSYTVPRDYSYKVLFSPAMLAAMDDPEHGDHVSGRVDALLRNINSMYNDERAREKSPSVVSIGSRFEGKVWLIDATERLSDALGIDQQAHFADLRNGARQKLRRALDKALRRHDAEKVLLDELVHLR